MKFDASQRKHFLTSSKTELITPLCISSEQTGHDFLRDYGMILSSKNVFSLHILKCPMEFDESSYDEVPWEGSAMSRSSLLMVTGEKVACCPIHEPCGDTAGRVVIPTLKKGCVYSCPPE